MSYRYRVLVRKSDMKDFGFIAKAWLRANRGNPNILRVVGHRSAPDRHTCSHGVGPRVYCDACHVKAVTRNIGKAYTWAWRVFVGVVVAIVAIVVVGVFA